MLCSTLYFILYTVAHYPAMLRSALYFVLCTLYPLLLLARDRAASRRPAHAAHSSSSPLVWSADVAVRDELLCAELLCAGSAVSRSFGLWQHSLAWRPLYFPLSCLSWARVLPPLAVKFSLYSPYRSGGSTPASSSFLREVLPAYCPPLGYST